MLNSSTRSGLARRRDDLREHARRGRPDEIIEALQSLWEMGGRKAPSREVGEKTAVQKVIDLADVQVWALWEATDRFRRGDVGEGALKPKTGQLRREALRLAKPFEDEARMIDKVLAAPIVEEETSADRARRKAMAERVRAEINAKFGGDK